MRSSPMAVHERRETMMISNQHQHEHHQLQKTLQRAPSISSCFPERFSLLFSPCDPHPPMLLQQQQQQKQLIEIIGCAHAHTQPHPLPLPQQALNILSDKAPQHHGHEEKGVSSLSSSSDSSSTSNSHSGTQSSSSSSSNGVSMADDDDDKVKHGHGDVNSASVPLPQVPSSLLLRKNITSRMSLYAPLYNAAMTGNWENAEKFLRSHPGAMSVRINNGMDTVLHIAAGAKHIKFVEEVVRLMSPNDLALRNKSNNTALCYAAASGVTRIAKIMVNKNRSLLGMRGNKGVTPLYIAALFGHREMVWYLYGATDEEHLTEEDYMALFTAAINSDLFDVALNIVQRKPELAVLQVHDGLTAFHILAQKRSAFASTSSLGLWQRLLYSLIRAKEKPKGAYTSRLSLSDINPTDQVSYYLLKKLQYVMELIVPGIKEVHDKKLMHTQALQLVKLLCEQVSLLEDYEIIDLFTRPSQPLLIAAKFGIVEVVTELLRTYPDLIWTIDEQNHSIFHIAVMYRQEKIFGLIHDIGAHKDMITPYKDDSNQNLLHLAGKLAPLGQLNCVSGAALQMQRELLWFKEVEKNVSPLSKQMRDKNGRTPRMLFTEEHRALVKDGEEWMKSTASSCMLVATLITTVMFAAIFTVPGGTDNNKGVPILLKSNAFITFAILDALALFLSVMSILMFLSILTSRYAEEDFLESLPKRLIVGLMTLFLSIGAMLVAFSAALFIVLEYRLAWVIVPIVLASCIPTALFAFLQFPLLADMLLSSYGTGIFVRETTI